MANKTTSDRKMSKAVILIINDAVTHNVTDDQAQLRFAPVCRDAAEIGRAMELFAHWRRVAHGSRQAEADQ